LRDEEEQKDQEIGLSQGEIISNYIIEKLISYTITESYRNEIDKSLGLHCFNFLKDMLNHMIIINNIAYEREDYDIEDVKELEEQPIFYDNIYYGFNDWSGINEPV